MTEPQDQRATAEDEDQPPTQLAPTASAAAIDYPSTGSELAWGLADDEVDDPAATRSGLRPGLITWSAVAASVAVIAAAGTIAFQHLRHTSCAIP
jgi:hypothetical protein